MRVLVTGAAGFIGSHVVDALLRAGHQVRALDAELPAVDLRSPGLPGNLAGAGADPACTLVHADLAADELLPALTGVDAVIHAAAATGLPADPADHARYRRCNIDATARTIQACREAGVRRLVHLSTSSVYGEEAVGDESVPLRPVSVYGETKQQAERIVAAAAAGGLDATTVRLFSVYGPRQRADMALHRFTEALLDDRRVELHGDGRQTRSFTYVGDAVRAILLALEHGRPGEAYNIAGEDVVPIDSALDTVRRALERDVVGLRRTPPRAGDQRATAGDTAKARTELGWRPLVAFEDGVRRQVAWHLARRAPGPAPALEVRRIRPTAVGDV